jgi:hypothetical protein
MALVEWWRAGRQSRGSLGGRPVMTARVEVEVVLAHSERATLRVGDTLWRNPTSDVCREEPSTCHRRRQRGSRCCQRESSAARTCGPVRSDAHLDSQLLGMRLLTTDSGPTG